MSECTLRLLASTLYMAPNILDPNISNIIGSWTQIQAAECTLLPEGFTHLGMFTEQQEVLAACNHHFSPASTANCISKNTAVCVSRSPKICCPMLSIFLIMLLLIDCILILLWFAEEMGANAGVFRAGLTLHMLFISTFNVEEPL